jgi:2-polyprenyl-6-methoxyphenol hydroxylase-like FAD-dependent oxidoreductase
MGRKAVVVGRGIAGLASAIGLRGRGWDVEVLGRAPAFEEGIRGTRRPDVAG